MEYGDIEKQLYTQDILIKKQDNDLIAIKKQLVDLKNNISILDHAISKLQENENG